MCTVSLTLYKEKIVRTLISPTPIAIFWNMTGTNSTQVRSDTRVMCDSHANKINKTETTKGKQNLGLYKLQQTTTEINHQGHKTFEYEFRTYSQISFNQSIVFDG